MFFKKKLSVRDLVKYMSFWMTEFVKLHEGIGDIKIKMEKLETEIRSIERNNFYLNEKIKELTIFIELILKELKLEIKRKRETEKFKLIKK